MLHRRHYSLLILGLAATAALAHAIVYALPFEDSFITFRYAENLAHGYGFSFNPGEHVEGCSSFAWTVLLSGFAAVGAPVPETAILLSLGAGVALVVATFALARRWVGHPGGFAWLAPILVASHGTFAYFAGSGMETLAFAALVTLAALTVTVASSRSAALSGVILGFSCWVRPEGIGYLALFALSLALGESDRPYARTLLFTGLAIAAPLFLFRLWYFGYPLPNTSYAKATPSLRLVRTGLVYGLNFVVSTGFGIVALGLLRIKRRTGSRTWSRLVAMLFGGAFVNAMLVGGDTFGFYRTFLPVLGPGAAALATALSLPEKKDPSARIRSILSVLAVLWASGASFVPRISGAGIGSSDFRATRSIASINADYFIVGRFLSENLPPNSWIALNAAGIVPYVSGLRTIDMLGLNDTHIAHHAVPSGEAAAVGHQKHDAAYVLGRRPDIILPGLPVLSPLPLVPDEIGAWYGRYAPFLPGDRELFRHPDLARLYRPVVIPLGSSGYLPAFVRRVTLPLVPSSD